MTTRRDLHDLVGGGLMAAVGLFFALYGSQYDFGTTARMGAGFFPVVLGWTLAVLGLLVAIPAWWRRGTRIQFDGGSLFWCVLSLLLFAFTLHLLGVVLASFLTALLSLSPVAMHWRTRLAVSAVVALLTTLIFPIGLQMILPIWPWSP